jgi:glutamine synthetase
MIQSGAYTPETQRTLDIGAKQLANIFKDNTDRNRTSPFAFTGNKFEFRACGSSASIAYPLSILNAAIADVFAETNAFLEKELAAGKTIDQALIAVTHKWYKNAHQIVFNGDGYSQDWVIEAEKRGLGNYRTSPEAIGVFKKTEKVKFLVEGGVFRQGELQTRANVMVERYIKCREIEFRTQESMVNKQILPCAISYKAQLSETVSKLKAAGADSSVEEGMLKRLSEVVKSLVTKKDALVSGYDKFHHSLNEDDFSVKIAKELMPICEEISKLCNQVEEIVPEDNWPLPKYYDMLFIR